MSDTPKRKVFLTAVRDNVTLAAGKELAKQYGPDSFTITPSRYDADIILYLEYGYLGLAELSRLLSCVRAAPRAMHFMFSEADWPFAVLPGAYPSLAKPTPWAQSWCYLPKPNVGASARPSAAEPKFLFSFLGRTKTHLVRQQILSLDNTDSPCLDVDAAPARLTGFDYSKSYWKLIADSKFSLCPRGFGVSSIRIFEVMAAGRAPVIISDQWQGPPGIPWDDFCVFVAEHDVLRIPAVLRQHQDDWQRRGQQAQKAFEQFFAPDVFFDRLLQTMMANYSKSGFTLESNLWRAWGALGWREFWSLGSQAKSLALKSLARLSPY